MIVRLMTNIFLCFVFKVFFLVFYALSYLYIKIVMEKEEIVHLDNVEIYM